MAPLDGKKVRLEALRRQIAKPRSFSAKPDDQVLLGVAEIDACLNGGLARGALHEIAAADHRSIPAALGFLLALTNICLSPTPYPPPFAGKDRLRPHSPFQPKNILWPFSKTAQAFGMPYAPGLRSFGFDPARIVFVRCASARDCLWAMEEGLHLGGIAAVIGARAKAMDLTASRRLQLAAEQAVTPVFLLRNHNDVAPSAAVTRWRVAPAPSAQDAFGFYEHARFHVALEYARGGKPDEWVMEWNHDALSLRISSALGDRAATGEDRVA